ncbi:MAG: hypothetical protein ACFB2Z_07955 [Maricaulaceae bacterium]
MQNPVAGAAGQEVVKRIGWLADAVGEPWASLIWLIIWALSALYVILAGYYALVLGYGGHENAHARRRYDGLRALLRDGGRPVAYYRRWVSGGLDQVDRFFEGEALAHRPKRQNWTHRLFGLADTPPIWTPWAFDRCLLLAVAYPVLTVVFMWVGLGELDAVGRSFGLATDLSVGDRTLAAGGVLTAGCGMWLLSGRASAWRRYLGVILLTGGGFAVAVAGAFAFALAVAVAFSVGLGVGCAVGFGVGVAVAVAFARTVAGAGAVAVAVAILISSDDKSAAVERQSRRLSLILAIVFGLAGAAVVLTPRFFAGGLGHGSVICIALAAVCRGFHGSVRTHLPTR